jgi:hypothetical protein
MTKYHITSKAGLDMGIYEGASKAEALCALHKDAGYWCHVEDDVILFRCDQDSFVCGQVKDWHFDECCAPDATTEEYQAAIDALNLEIVDVIESHSENLPIYEVAHAMISQAVSLMLCTAPTHLVAFKTALTSIESGIASYEGAHSPKDGE